MNQEISNVKFQIIEMVNPLSIYLFGSSTRKNLFRPPRDYDFCVVVSDEVDVIEVLKTLNCRVKRETTPLDFVVLNFSRFKERKDLVGSFVHTVHEDGVLIHGFAQ